MDWLTTIGPLPPRIARLVVLLAGDRPPRPTALAPVGPCGQRARFRPDPLVDCPSCGPGDRIPGPDPDRVEADLVARVQAAAGPASGPARGRDDRHDRPDPMAADLRPLSDAHPGRASAKGPPGPAFSHSAGMMTIRRTGSPPAPGRRSSRAIRTRPPSENIRVPSRRVSSDLNT